MGAFESGAPRSAVRLAQFSFGHRLRIISSVLDCDMGTMHLGLEQASQP